MPPEVARRSLSNVFRMCLGAHLTEALVRLPSSEKDVQLGGDE